MQQKNFVVVGGSKGIGLATVHKLIREGHSVLVVSRQKDELPDHKNITYIEADMTTDDLSSVVWPDVLDGLVYCPGSIVLKPFKSLSDAQFIEDFNINCLGAIRSIRAVLNMLKKSENNPGIVLFSTVAVSQGMPFHASIATAKGAVEGLIRSLAAEFAPTIRVNGIAPSLTETTLASKLLSSPDKTEAASLRHPLKSIGKAEDLAALATFLLSDEARWITGQIMHADGGMSSLRV